MKVKPLMDDLIDWLTLRELLPPPTCPVHRARGAPDERSVNGVDLPPARHQGQLPLAHDREEPAPHTG